MLKATKYTNVGTSLLGLSAEILNLLSEEPYQKYNQILDKIIYRKGESAKENFLLSLSFLYLLGKIEYSQGDDVIQLLNSN